MVYYFDTSFDNRVFDFDGREGYVFYRPIKHTGGSLVLFAPEMALDLIAYVIGGMLVFFIFQSLRKLFFDQVKLNPKLNYVPISKKVRFSFLTCLYVGCFYFIGLVVALGIYIDYYEKQGGVW